MSMICTLGDQIDSYPHFSEDTLKRPVILDEVRAGGRIPLIIGLGIAPKARVALVRDSNVSNSFALPKETSHQPGGYSLPPPKWSGLSSSTTFLLQIVSFHI